MMIYIDRIDRQTEDEATVTISGPVEDVSVLTTGEYPGLEGLTRVTRTVLTMEKPGAEEDLQTKLDELAGILTDEQAVQHLDIYAPLLGDGKAIQAGQRRRVGDELYKANVTLWDSPDRWPDAEPTLWTKITSSGDIEDWVPPTGAHEAYYFGDIRAHAGKAWRSTVADTADGKPQNVWEPGVYGWEGLVG